jgi:hypothetical protein
MGGIYEFALCEEPDGIGIANQHEECGGIRAKRRKLAFWHKINEIDPAPILFFFKS